MLLKLAPAGRLAHAHRAADGRRVADSGGASSAELRERGLMDLSTSVLMNAGHAG